MKYVALCLIVGLLGFVASAYVAFRVAHYQVTQVEDDLSDLTAKGEYRHSVRIRNAFTQAFFPAFTAGAALTLGSIAMILYFKRFDGAPPEVRIPFSA